jgi:Tol biopolymer transport system component
MTPPALDHVIRRCLAKELEQRWQTASDLPGELRWIAEGVSQAQMSASVPTRIMSRERYWIALALASLAAAIVFGVLYWNHAPERRQVIRSSIQPAPNSSFALSAGFAISPDGKRLAYVASGPEGNTILWIRPIDSLQAQPLAGTDRAGFPFWSPDSRFIGFFAGNKLKKIEASGSPPVALCDVNGNFRGGTWGAEGEIVFAPNNNTPLYRVSAAGGTATQVTTLDESKGEITHRWPQFLPDGRHFLYLAGSPYAPRETPTNTIMVGSLDSKESKILLRTHSNAMYTSGHLLYLRLNALMAQPFDVKRLEFTGEAFPIADQVAEYVTSIQGLFSAAANGVLVHAEASGEDRQLIWSDRSGKKVGEVPGTDAYGDQPRISPDGKRLVFQIVGSGVDLWIEEISRSVKTRLTFGSSSAQSDESAVWSPDGQWVAYTSIRAGKQGLNRKAADGSGNEEVLLEPQGQALHSADWSPDGQYLAFGKQNQGVWTLWMLPVYGERKPYAF